MGPDFSCVLHAINESRRKCESDLFAVLNVVREVPHWIKELRDELGLTRMNSQWSNSQAEDKQGSPSATPHDLSQVSAEQRIQADESLSRSRALRDKTPEHLDQAIAQRKAQEAFNEGRKDEWQKDKHDLLLAWLARKGFPEAGCRTLNHDSGSGTACTACGTRHWWYCHCCSSVQMTDSCVNGCESDKFGWSCIYSSCLGDSCPCQKGTSYWRDPANSHVY